jgi:hypothetical protein
MPYPLERPIDTKSAQKTPLFRDRQEGRGALERGAINTDLVGSTFLEIPLDSIYCSIRDSSRESLRL